MKTDAFSTGPLKPSTCFPMSSSVFVNHEFRVFPLTRLSQCKTCRTELRSGIHWAGGMGASPWFFFNFLCCALCLSRPPDTYQMELYLRPKLLRIVIHRLGRAIHLFTASYIMVSSSEGDCGTHASWYQID
jgi:hypothetical protein